MKKKEELFRIVLKPPDFNLKESLEINAYELAIIILDKIKYGVDNNIDEVNIAEIVHYNGIITLKSTKSNYIKVLQTNIETLVKFEDYERCAECKKYIEMLKEI